jgi:hypothetical protein
MAEQRIRRNADGTPANQTSSNNSSDSSVTRTTGRVDHPAGKQQYMDPVEPEQNPFEEADKGSTVTVSYSIKVISCPDKSRVKNILSARRTPVQGDITLPITVSYSEASKGAVFEKAKNLVAAGAKIEVKKKIVTEISLL